MIARLLPVLAVAALAASAQTPQPAAPSAPAAPAPTAETVLPPPTAPDSQRFARYFAPLRTEHAALSPDGRYLAFSLRQDDQLHVITTEVDRPDVALAKVLVGTDASSTRMLAQFQHEPTPTRIRWMRWTSANRLVLETNLTTDIVQGDWHSATGAILAFDADGKNASILVDPKDVREASLEAPPAGEPQVNRFNLQRNNSEFEQRVNAPNRPFSEETDGGRFGQEQLRQELAANTLDPAAETPDLGDRPGTQPRSISILRPDPTKPGQIQFLALGADRAEGFRAIQTFLADARTGHLTPGASDTVRSDRDFLLDQQGRLRITLPNTIIPGFPHAYEYLGLGPLTPRRKLGEVVPRDAHDGFTVSPENYFGERDLPLGFDLSGQTLYYASNRGRDTFGVYSVDLATGRPGKVAFENPRFDLIAAPQDAFPPDTLVFDPHRAELVGIRYDHVLRTAAWLKPELREVQATLERLLPGRAVDLVDWDAAFNRFVVATQAPADAGAFYLYDRSQARLSEFARRAPWLDAEHTFATVPFSYPRPDGTVISGLLSVPATPRLKPVPMVVVCPDVPWQRVRSDFRSEIHALADMGFAVVQINGRGAWGQGARHRQLLAAGYDTVQIDDLVTTLAELEKRFHVNPGRVALFGRGHGGFIALRALQDFPEKFRCAIAIDPPVDLLSWLEQSYWSNGAARPQLVRGAFGDAARLRAAPLVSAPEKLTKPLLLLSYPGLEGGPRLGTYTAAKSFVWSINRSGPAEFVDLTTDFMRGLPQARSATFARIEEFLNLHIYSYKVKLGEAQKVELLREK